MGSLSNTLLRGGQTVQLAFQGEPIAVLSGAAAGQTFTGMILMEPSLGFTEELGADPRERSMIYFPDSAYPRLNSQDVIRDSDGQKWKCVKRTANSSDIWIEFEIVKMVKGIDAP